MLKEMFKVMFQFLGVFKIPFIIFFSVCMFFTAEVFLFWLYLRFVKKQVPIRGEHYKLKKRSLLLRVFWDAPQAYARDLMNRNPEFFRYQGVIIFCGRQGSGKSIALAEYTRRMKKEYPKAKILSNFGYKNLDVELNHWNQLLDYKNGIQGVIVQIDEMQNWFSSNQSKNFPPEMLETVTQNRKNRRIILGTSQVFCRLAKPLREQCTEIRNCITLFGCVTVVIRYEPLINSEGDVEKKKYRGMYFFVHDDDLRNSYDTYRVIESLSRSGFQENPKIKQQNQNINLKITG